MNKNLNIIMVSEVCAQMGANYVPGSEKISYGTGAIVFELMNSVAERLRQNDSVTFDEVKLMFFKTRWDWIRKQSGGEEYCDLFSGYMVTDFAHNDCEYIESHSDRLCAVQSVNEALSKIYRDDDGVSVLVFASYTPNIFANSSADDVLLSAENIPDLSFFFLNGVSDGEAALLAKFNTGRYNARIISFDSVEADINKFYNDLTDNINIKNAVNYSIDSRRGLAYSIYGLLKSALKINHSLAAGIEFST